MISVLGVVLLMSASCLGKPASYTDNLIDSDLNRTVEEVIDVLGKRTDLPRLTRGEILELVSDVRKGKADPLVVVMPVKNNGASMEELFTQPPVTQVIGDLATRLASKRPGMKRRRRPVPHPVYVHTEATTSIEKNHSFPFEDKPTTPIQSQSTTPASEGWNPIDQLVIPEDMRDAIQEITVGPNVSKPAPFTAIPLPKQKTTKPAVPPEDVSVAAESLSDEMKDLLATFGLLGNKAATEETEAVKTGSLTPGFDLGLIKPKVDPNSYIGFKPLPESGDISPDMKSFLASFGLVNERSGKSLVSDPSSGKKKRSKDRDDRILKHVPQIEPEMFSDDMISVLENLGISNNQRSGKRLGQHIFNPAQRTAELNKTDQIEKVQKLVTKIKELSKNHEIHSLTPSELKDLLETEAELIQLGSEGNLLIKTDSLSNGEGPDPLSLDEIVELLDKNESKRQDSSEGSSTTIKNPNISTRRYDNGDDVTFSDSATEEDATADQTTDNVVTIPPDAAAPQPEPSVMTNSSTTASSSSEASSTTEGASSSSNSEASSSSNSEASSSSSSEASSSAKAADSSSVAAESLSETDNQPMAAEGPTFEELSESFGGEVTTTPRPNGLYFLLDWNSFLQVGTDERKVDLTFNPKIGDARNFYPIKFP